MFDKGLKASEGVVPFGGDAVEVVAEIEDGSGVELKEAVAAGADGAHDAGALENAQMLGDGLAGEARAVGELGDGTRTVAKAGEERETGAVAEGGEGAGRVGRRRLSMR
jgi:hypothetical protein